MEHPSLTHRISLDTRRTVLIDRLTRGLWGKDRGGRQLRSCWAARSRAHRQPARLWQGTHATQGAGRQNDQAGGRGGRHPAEHRWRLFHRQPSAAGFGQAPAARDSRGVRRDRSRGRRAVDGRTGAGPQGAGPAARGRPGALSRSGELPGRGRAVVLRPRRPDPAARGPGRRPLGRHGRPWSRQGEQSGQGQRGNHGQRSEHGQWCPHGQWGQ